MIFDSSAEVYVVYDDFIWLPKKRMLSINDFKVNDYSTMFGHSSFFFNTPSAATQIELSNIDFTNVIITKSRQIVIDKFLREFTYDDIKKIDDFHSVFINRKITEKGFNKIKNSKSFLWLLNNKIDKYREEIIEDGLRARNNENNNLLTELRINPCSLCVVRHNSFSYDERDSEIRDNKASICGFISVPTKIHLPTRYIYVSPLGNDGITNKVIISLETIMNISKDVYDFIRICHENGFGRDNKLYTEFQIRLLHDQYTTDNYSRRMNCIIDNLVVNILKKGIF